MVVSTNGQMGILSAPAIRHSVAGPSLRPTVSAKSSYGLGVRQCETVWRFQP